MSAHSVNDKAAISHEIEKKTSLSKRNDGKITNKNVRAVGGEKKPEKAEKIAPNVPKPVERNAAYYSNNAP